MILHHNTLISLDLFEKEFVCNLSACKGACCVEGDIGAPLEATELEDINRNLNGIKPFMTPTALAQLELHGFSEKDDDDELVTQCINGRDCIFAISENGAYKCAIEKAFEQGKSDFMKPISCHLYPIRLSNVGEYEAINYDKWSICSDACTLGEQLKVPVYKFLQAPLVRKYGQQWYDELAEIAQEFAAAK